MKTVCARDYDKGCPAIEQLSLNKHAIVSLNKHTIVSLNKHAIVSLNKHVIVRSEGAQEII